MKLTDNEIIKALKCCGRKHNEKNDTYCKECQFKSYLPCVAFLCDRTIDLINRQKAEIEFLRASEGLDKAEFNELKAEIELKKAEIERLTNAYKQCAWERDIFAEDCNAVKTKAIKEFWKMLKRKAFGIVDPDSSIKVIDVADGDNLVKEMVGE